MENLAFALIIIALLILATILILTDHPVWAGIFILLTGAVKINEKSC